ncbi:ankyrin repeat domain-containing protein SOWAHC [Amblyraja radiata]|uniref:ankyrin repeat domain-containing protein SOWAHC n=1 Tax=Amblyraja radiata TaxID=386614 RepID=UPI001403D2DB|nr:ankyrin repeat domain-containing protein SOWAHC [Amblyraja radiata]
MATEFSCKAVWQFLSEKGGKVESTELLEHFRDCLNDPKTRETARGQFKEFVNKVGLVVQEDGVKYIRLKKKYRGKTDWSEASASDRGHGSKEDGGGMENGDRQRAVIGFQSAAQSPQPGSGDGVSIDPSALLSSPEVECGRVNNSCSEECNESNGTVPEEQRSIQQDGRIPWHAHTNDSPKHYISSSNNSIVSNINTEGGNHIQVDINHVAKSENVSLPLSADLDESLPNPDFSQTVPSAKDGADLLADAYNLLNISKPDTDGNDTVTWKLPECPAKQTLESKGLENVDSSVHDTKSKNHSVRLSALHCNFPPTQVKTSPDINTRRPSRKRLQRSLAVNRSSSVCDEGNTGENPTDVSGVNSESLNTPRSSRKNFREMMISGSPQLRHSVVYGNPVVAFPNIKQGDSGFGRNDVDSSSLTSAKLDDEDSGPVTLDPLEHEWMLHASEGKWDSIEALLIADPSLITWKDFVTGFTCIHWAAKHGKPELLAMLVNYARKHNIPININVRSGGGYTPLHLAAMHGHTEVVKLLSGAYDADVDIRDYSGKKAWQYMGQNIAEELGNLIGASTSSDSENALRNGNGRWRLSKVFPANLTYKLTSAPEEEVYCDGTAAKAVNWKSTTNKMKFNRIRFKTQIIHSVPSLRGQNDQRDPKSALKLRPKSTIFG